MKSQSGKFTLFGDALCIGRDSGDAVSEECKSPGTFKRGMIKFVEVTVEKAQYLDPRSSPQRTGELVQRKGKPSCGPHCLRRR